MSTKGEAFGSSAAAECMQGGVNVTGVSRAPAPGAAGGGGVVLVG